MDSAVARLACRQDGGGTKLHADGDVGGAKLHAARMAAVQSCMQAGRRRYNG